MANISARPDLAATRAWGQIVAGGVRFGVIVLLSPAPDNSWGCRTLVIRFGGLSMMIFLGVERLVSTFQFLGRTLPGELDARRHHRNGVACPQWFLPVAVVAAGRQASDPGALHHRNVRDGGGGPARCGSSLVPRLGDVRTVLDVSS